MKEEISIFKVNNQDSSVVEEYWKRRLDDMRVQAYELEVKEGQADKMLLSMIEVVEEAVNLGQYSKPVSMYEPTRRIVKINTYTPRYLLDKIPDLKVIPVFGIGVFVEIEGLLLSSSFRNKSNFDRFGKKGVIYDVSFLDEELRKDYEFGLSISALDGVFVPKKSGLTSLITRARQLQFFDITF